MAKFKAYITKYALTRGILEVVVEPCDTIPNAVWDNDGCYYYGAEWYGTREDAVARVRDVIATTRNTTKKNLARLEELERSLEDE